MINFSSLTAISPIDGRYANKISDLRLLFSEYAIMRFRLWVEIRWLQVLTHDILADKIPSLSESAQTFLNEIFDNFSEEDAQTIKKIEATTNHDVKAVEYFLKEKITHHQELTHVMEYVHFACTSEDINNLSYALALKAAREQHLLPYQKKILTHLSQWASEYADRPMLARTHGQPATPTTMGKEMANVVARLERQIQQLSEVAILGKFNGAVGNYNAHSVAYPSVNWENASKKFVESLGLDWNAYTTQIEPHDYIAEYCDALKRCNNILIDFSHDMWGYISLGYFKQKINAHETGSSTMPHKVNPIDFENAESNLSLANTLCDHFTRHLTQSRWQRDLRDSTLLRNLGVAVAHSLLAYQNILQALNKATLDTNCTAEDLNQHWEVLGEAIQTVLRCHGHSMPYEKLKNLTRGKKIDQAMLHRFIRELALPDHVQACLLELTPMNYLGYAVKLAKEKSLDGVAIDISTMSAIKD